MRRHVDSYLLEHFKKYKEVMIILGARQVGKTTLVKRLFPDAQYLLVDNEPVRRILESYDINTYKNIIKNKEVIIDEIHMLSNPGRAIKIIYDQMPDIRLIITGSSSFHIKNKTSESLAGRKIDYYLYPLTFSEYLFQNNIESKLNFNIFENIIQEKLSENDIQRHIFDLNSILKIVLCYGLFPNMVNHPQDKRYLLNFAESLIFKDILELNLIENKKLASDLLKLLAYQIGNIINYSELATKLQADQRTIKRYLEIFEQSFILYRLYPYSRNKRDEIIKSPKIYFYDTGLRNAIINNFSDIDIRADAGALFENFIISEVIKSNCYLGANYKIYYWRNKQQSEVDLVLEKEDKLIGVEIKMSKARRSFAFQNRYKVKLQILNSNNFY